MSEQSTVPPDERLKAAVERFCGESSHYGMAELRALHYLLGRLEGLVGPDSPEMTKAGVVGLVEESLQHATQAEAERAARSATQEVSA